VSVSSDSSPRIGAFFGFPISLRRFLRQKRRAFALSSVLIGPLLNLPPSTIFRFPPNSVFQFNLPLLTEETKPCLPFPLSRIHLRRPTGHQVSLLDKLCICPAPPSRAGTRHSPRGSNFPPSSGELSFRLLDALRNAGEAVLLLA